jgi:hypothetical protein
MIVYASNFVEIFTLRDNAIVHIFSFLMCATHSLGILYFHYIWVINVNIILLFIITKIDTVLRSTICTMMTKRCGDLCLLLVMWLMWFHHGDHSYIYVEVSSHVKITSALYRYHQSRDVSISNHVAPSSNKPTLNWADITFTVTLPLHTNILSIGICQIVAGTLLMSHGYLRRAHGQMSVEITFKSRQCLVRRWRTSSD